MYELNCRSRTSGGTVTAIRYLAGVALTPLPMTEIGTTKRYTGHMAGVAGVYQLDFLKDGVVESVGEIDWNGTAEVRASTPAAIATAVWGYER